MIEPSLSSIIEHDICVMEIISYFDCIFDFKLLLLTNKTNMDLLLKNKRLIRLISEGNLNTLMNNQLNISYNDFKMEFLLPFELVLSGSTMLYSICGKNWGFHTTNKINENLLPDYEQTFSDEQLKFVRKNKINTEPDDYDLYINTSISLVENYYDLRAKFHRAYMDVFSITKELKKKMIFIDYKFPNAEDDIHYLIVHIQNLHNKELTLNMLSSLFNKTIDDAYELPDNENTMEFLERIFDVMYNYRFDLLATYSDLQDINCEYYNKINVMRLYYYNDISKKKIKLQIIFNNEVQSKFNNYDFKFLQTYLDPMTNDINGGINYNGSLKSILSRNNDFNELPYKHCSAKINPEKQILSRSRFPVLFSTNYVSESKLLFAEKIARIISHSLMRCLKYSSRGFNCMNGLITYASQNLPNLYLNIKSSTSEFQKNKFEGLLKEFIILEDGKVFLSLWIIHRFSIKLYTKTINDGVPDVLYLADDALYYNEDNGMYHKF